MADTKTTPEAKVKAERKMMVLEIKRLQQQLKEAQAKCQHQKQKINQHQAHELALMQTNRLLADIVKTYADREATLMANWRTLQQTFGQTTTPETIDLEGD